MSSNLIVNNIEVGTGATIYTAASNQLTFGTNGGERLRINGSGRVGVGTDSPGAFFDIRSNNTAELRLWTHAAASNATLNIRGGDNGISAINFGDTADDDIGRIQFVNTSGDNSFRFFTNYLERLRITLGGNIGIGTTNPQQQLHVQDDTIYKGILINGSNAPRLAFARTTTTTGEWSVGIDGTNGNQFAINNSNDNSNRKVIISSSQIMLMSNTSVSGDLDIADGKVGIGTNNPVGNLEVRDSKANLIVAKDGLTVKNNSDIAATYDLIQLGAGGALASYSTATATADTQFIHNAYRHSGNNWKYRYADTAMRLKMNSPGRAFIFESAASGSADADITWSEKIRIGSAGQFGIGGANYGSSGQVLTSQGGSAAPQWATAASGGWTVHSTTSASGNSEISVTSGLSDSTTTIEIIVHRLRAGNSAAHHQVQIGTSSGWAGTYNDIQRYFVNVGSQETNRGHDQNQFSAWHGQGNPFAQTNVEFSGTFTLNKVSTGNYVIESQSICDRTDNNNQYLLHNAGRVELGAALSRIRIFTSNSSNFSAGTVVIRSM